MYLEEARDNLYLEHYSSILTNISERFEPVLVKISPALDESSQLQYLKKQRILVLWQALFQMTVATLPLVSSSILIIHLEFLQPISASSIQICLKRKKRAQHLKKNHFGNASLAKEEPIEKEFPFNWFLVCFHFKRFPIFRAQEIRFLSA